MECAHWFCQVLTKSEFFLTYFIESLQYQISRIPVQLVHYVVKSRDFILQPGGMYSYHYALSTLKDSHEDDQLM
jgi:acid phosphatase family membrane protein YuiD